MYIERKFLRVWLCSGWVLNTGTNAPVAPVLTTTLYLMTILNRVSIISVGSNLKFLGILSYTWRIKLLLVHYKYWEKIGKSIKVYLRFFLSYKVYCIKRFIVNPNLKLNDLICKTKANLLFTLVQALSTFDPPYVTLKSRVPMFCCKVVSHIVLKGEIIFGLVFGKVTWEPTCHLHLLGDVFVFQLKKNSAVSHLIFRNWEIMPRERWNPIFKTFI